MSLNIVDYLEKLKPHYHSAIFFTYSLNLVFFENMVLPKLEQLGIRCNIILADPFGYDEAIATGQNNIQQAGRHYICTPLRKKEIGVQHAKLLLLVGEKHGVLITGSGNLTFYGYGRNLEVVDVRTYELDNKETHREQATFYTIWHLLESFLNEERLNDSTLIKSLNAIRVSAEWITSIPRTLNRPLIHSYNQSILDQIDALPPVDELRIVSPYFNQGSLEEIIIRKTPQKLSLFVDPKETYLDVEGARIFCDAMSCELELYAITAVDKANRGSRNLHAKVFVGIHARGSWCISGSANCTYPALISTWSGRGNLELMTIQTSEDSTAFDNIFRDETIQVEPLQQTSVKEQVDDEGHQLPDTARIYLSDVTYIHPRVCGQITTDIQASEWLLEFNTLDSEAEIQIDTDGMFETILETQLDKASVVVAIAKDANGTEIARSPAQFIQQVAILNRYGSRLYQVRIRENLNSFAGAESQFRELMDFLWENLDIEELSNPDTTMAHRPVRRGRITTDNDETSDDNSQSVDSYYTDEDIDAAIWKRIQTLNPYDRDIASLNDLLSLTLLKLTAPISEIVSENAAIEDFYDNTSEMYTDDFKKQQEQQEEAFTRLRRYIKRYCRHYKETLFTEEFIKSVDLSRLFTKHEILSRVLIELGKKGILTHRDAMDCALNVWQPIIGSPVEPNRGQSAFNMLGSVKGGIEIVQKNSSELSKALFVILIADTWGDIPSFQQAKVNPRSDEEAMLARLLIAQSEVVWGKEYWTGLQWEDFGIEDVMGYRGWSDLLEEEIQAESMHLVLRRIKRLHQYKHPAINQYSRLFQWENAVASGRSQEPEMKKLYLTLRDLFPDELKILHRANDKALKWVIGDNRDCANCYVQLPDIVFNNLKRYGKLEVCGGCGQLLLWRSRYSWE